MLHDKTRALCGGPNFAALTTLFSDGQPQTQVMWVGCDDDHVLINTERHRVKFKNTEGDPRVTVTVWDATNPYSYVEVRGRVVDRIGGDEARSHIDELAQTYTGADYANEITSERVILKIAPDREVIH
jgi:PPOX class probable F420-dependent enzyme